MKTAFRGSGHARTFLVHTPPAETLNAHPRRVPLVVVLHGAFTTGKATARVCGMNRIADAEGFVVAYPEGIGHFGFLQHWNAGHCCGPAVERGVDDVAYVSAVIEQLAATLPIDRRRIYIVGFSNGGMLAHRIAAERSGDIAAFAVVSGAAGGRVNDEIGWELPAAAAPVAGLIMHGTADVNIPFEGGTRADKPNERSFESVNYAVDEWRANNRLPGLPRVARLQDGRVRHSAWPGGAAALELYAIEGWGHQWPSAELTGRLPEGDALRGFDSARIIWDFFEAKGRRSRD